MKINIGEILEKCKEIVMTGLEKIKALPKKVLIPSLIGIITLVLVISILPACLTNTYKTPLNIDVKLMNSRKYIPYTKSSLQTLNGFAKKEFKTIYGIIETSDAYKDEIEENEEDFLDYVENKKDDYGKNYKYSYEVTFKEKLEKEDLIAFRKQLRYVADEIDTILEETDDFDSDDWEDFADELELSKRQAKDLIKACENLKEIYNDARVTDGYCLEVVLAVNGSELDEPEESEREINVYKVDGRWVYGYALTNVGLLGEVLNY